MATPGWYPDPAGQPGTFRYWDGQGWGPDTSPDPYADSAPGRPDSPTIAPGAPAPPVPGPPAPPAATDSGTQGFQSYETGPGAYPQQPSYQQSQQPSYQQPGYSQPGYSQPGYSQPGPPPPDGAKSSGRTAAVVLGIVLVTLLLAIATFFVVRPLVDDDGDAASDPSGSPADTTDTTDDAPQPTDQPSEQPTDSATEQPSEPPSGDPGDPFADDRVPTARECSGGSPRLGSTPPAGGRQSGGGLSMPQPQGFSATGNLDQSASFVFATGVSATSQVVVDGWVAVHALGALPRDNGFESTGQSAADVLECMTRSSSFYRSFTGAEVLDSRAVEVDGNPGWLIDAEIRVDDPEIRVEGDVAKVLVVDTGSLDSYGVFVSLVAIGSQDLIAQQQRLADQVTVD